MCINEDVQKLSTVLQMNDRCLDMQKSKSKSADGRTSPSHPLQQTAAASSSTLSSKPKTASSKSGASRKTTKSSTCPYLNSGEHDAYKEHILVFALPSTASRCCNLLAHNGTRLVWYQMIVQDMEELVTNGKRLRCCPYYSSRSAIRSSELVALPYNMLVHSDMRNALGITLKGNVVIIDEAHNLAESISSLFSISISATQVRTFHDLPDRDWLPPINTHPQVHAKTSLHKRIASCRCIWSASFRG
jgi:chromosome transmission fidelity protein 1